MKWKHFIKIIKFEKLDFIGDIRDKERLNIALNGIDVVIMRLH